MNAPNLKFIAHIVTLEICTRALVTARTTDCFKEYAILENSPDVRTTRHLLDYSSCQSFAATALPTLTAGPEKFIDPQAPLFSMAAGEGEDESLSGGIDLP